LQEDHSVVGQWACLVEGQPDVGEVKAHLEGREDREDGVDMEGNDQTVVFQPSREDNKDQVSHMVAVATTWRG
jgi:hypothetical protein